MAVGIPVLNPIPYFTDNAGRPAAGGSVLTQVGGINAPTYSDVGLTTPLQNPIPLNSRGEASTSSGTSTEVFLPANIVYSFTLFDRHGNLIWTAPYLEGVQLTQSQVAQLLFPQTPAEAAAGVTPTNFQYSPTHIGDDVRRYGATGNGTTDDTAAFATASSVAADGGAGIYVPPGTYRIASNIAFTTPLFFDANATLKPDAGVVITMKYAPQAGAWPVFNVSTTTATNIANGTTPIAGALLGPPLLVEWFGAVGDGSTDDFIPIQACFNAGQQSSNARVQLLGKVYATTQTLYACGNVAAANQTPISLYGITRTPAICMSVLTDAGAFAVANTPILKYRCSGPSLDAHVELERVAFDSTTTTFAIGVWIEQMTTLQPRKCLFGNTALFEGIRWHSPMNGFCEDSYTEACEFINVTPSAHFTTDGGTSSFRRCGLWNNTMVPANLGAVIVIDNGANLYHGMLDVNASGSSGPLIQNNDSTDHALSFHGHISWEYASAGVTLASGSPVYFIGTIEMDGGTASSAVISNGSFLMADGFFVGGTGANGFLRLRHTNTGTLASGANTITVPLGDTYRVHLWITGSAGGYQKSFDFIVQGVPGTSVITSPGGGTTITPGVTVDTPTWGNPTFAIVTGGFSITNANFTGTVSYIAYCEQIGSMSVNGFQVSL